MFFSDLRMIRGVVQDQDDHATPVQSSRVRQVAGITNSISQARESWPLAGKPYKLQDYHFHGHEKYQAPTLFRLSCLMNRWRHCGSAKVVKLNQEGFLWHKSRPTHFNSFRNAKRIGRRLLEASLRKKYRGFDI